MPAFSQIYSGEQIFLKFKGFYLVQRSILRIWTVWLRDFENPGWYFPFPLGKVLAWDFWVYWSVLLFVLQRCTVQQAIQFSLGNEQIFYCIHYSQLCSGFRKSMFILDTNKWKKQQHQNRDMIFILLSENLILLYMDSSLVPSYNTC